MAIDPSIIGNVMAPAAPQLPDVNAMLETQTRGAENIYKIDMARQMRAQLEQEKATADQEAATIKALLPAYTYGIQTGDMAGALNLVPPEMQEGLRPYVDALAGKSPDEVKAALIGSLSSSAMGQEALAAIQRAGTLSVQQGQLTLAQQNAAREAAAAGQPKPMTEYEKVMSGFKEREVKAAEEKAAREASGALTDKQEKSKVTLDDTIARIKAHYDTLKTEKAIVSQDNSALENAAARASTLTGVTYGRTVGTKAQTARDSIANLRQSILTDIKNATGMTAKEMDSNQDVQRLLASLGDPDQSYETILDTLANLSAKYGAGRFSGVVGSGTAAAAPPPVDASGFEILGTEPE